VNNLDQGKRAGGPQRFQSKLPRVSRVSPVSTRRSTPLVESPPRPNRRRAGKKSFDVSREGTGTREWSDGSYNICRGCAHGCLYCYARSRACIYHPDLRGPGQWCKQVLNPNRSQLGAELRNVGVVMFPTSHDITPSFLPEALVTIENLLAKNKVLVVTKAHLSVVRKLCERFTDRKTDLVLRFTIGSLDPDLCAFWEPGAPAPAERVEALQYAFAHGFVTSVSIEPMLDSWERTVELVDRLLPYANESIWIGKMRKIPRKLNAHVSGLDEAIALIKSQQSDENIAMLVSSLKLHPTVQWKDSIREVIGRTGAGAGAVGGI
jgi:DNA repair photolyase